MNHIRQRKFITSSIFAILIAAMAAVSHGQTPTNDGAGNPQDVPADDVLDYLPAIIAAAKPISRWGVEARVCCETSPLTFSVTIAGETKESVVASCAGSATFDGYSDIEAGEYTPHFPLPIVNLRHAKIFNPNANADLPHAISLRARIQSIKSTRRDCDRRAFRGTFSGK